MQIHRIVPHKGEVAVDQLGAAPDIGVVQPVGAGRKQPLRVGLRRSGAARQFHIDQFVAALAEAVAETEAGAGVDGDVFKAHRSTAGQVKRAVLALVQRDPVPRGERRLRFRGAEPAVPGVDDFSPAVEVGGIALPLFAVGGEQVHPPHRVGAGQVGIALVDREFHYPGIRRNRGDHPLREGQRVVVDRQVFDGHISAVAQPDRVFQVGHHQPCAVAVDGHAVELFQLDGAAGTVFGLRKHDLLFAGGNPGGDLLLQPGGGGRQRPRQQRQGEKQ